MENSKVLHALDEFAKAKPKDIPGELDDYIRFVAGCGDHVYQWSLVKCLFRQKLVNVISEFYESCPMMDVPVSPNVDAFNYEHLKSRLLQRFDRFTGAPFTIQRIAELLTAPRKQYNRVDKFMRAIEKNIWVVSTREPGRREVANPETIVNVNGMPASDDKLQKSQAERLKRQADLFDDEEDDEDSEEEQVGTVALGIPLLLPQLTGESSTSTAGPEENISDATEPSPTSSPDQLESYSKPSEPEVESTSIEETCKEPVEEIASVADAPSSDEPLVEKEEVQENQEEEEPNEKSISDVASPEVAESDVVDVPPDPVVSVEEPEEKVDGIEPENKADLKRKFDDEEDDKEVPHKKLGTEERVAEDESQEVVEEPKEAEEEVKVAEVITEVIDVSESEREDDDAEEVTDVPLAVEISEEKETEQKEKEPETAAEEVETVADVIVQVEELTEKDMESVESEEKVEMVVEEPELAMDVDESSVQSPMECAVAEPMDATDVGQS